VVSELKICTRTYILQRVDSAIARLSQRFKSPAFKMACDIETLFMDVINKLITLMIGKHQK